MKCLLAAVVVLLCLPGPVAAEWRIQSATSRIADKQVKYAEVPARAADQGVDATLELTCNERQRWYAVRLSRSLSRGEIGASLRIDEGKVEPRFLRVFSDPNRIPIIQAPPFDLISNKRFRVELHLNGGPVLFYDFDITGVAAAAKAIAC
jgi:hypothetical protein